MIDREIWIAANEMMKLYADNEAVIAGNRVEVLMNMGVVDRCRTWLRVIRAIRDLESVKPRGPTN